MIDNVSEKKLTIASFKGAWEREVIIKIKLEPDTDEGCTVCKKIKPVLTMDGSGGEYSAGYICKDCIDKAFSEVRS